jgi:lipopolysaccharide biosynthesis glycosyltransferase
MTASAPDAIVTGVTPNWMPLAAVTLLFCITHGGKPDAELLICVHRPDEADLDTLARFNARHGIAIRVIPVDGAELGVATSGLYNIGTMIRLGLDRYLGPHYARVLYLDSDLLVRGSLDPLFATGFDGCSAAAVIDIMMHTRVHAFFRENLASIGFGDEDLYFNAGVLLFDWAACLRERVLPRARDLLAEPSGWLFPDQNALNIVLRHKWKRLAPRWNVVNDIDDALTVATAIRHFADTRKPWLANCRWQDRRYRAYYQSALKDMPWETVIEDASWSWRHRMRLWRHRYYRKERTTRRELATAYRRFDQR